MLRDIGKIPINEGVEPIPPPGVKVAESFTELAKKIGWDTKDIQSDISLQEFLQPLFEKEYLRLCNYSIILTLEGFIMSAYLESEEMSPEVKV